MSYNGMMVVGYHSMQSICTRGDLVFQTRGYVRPKSASRKRWIEYIKDLRNLMSAAKLLSRVNFENSRIPMRTLCVLLHQRLTPKVPRRKWWKEAKDQQSVIPYIESMLMLIIQFKKTTLQSDVLLQLLNHRSQQGWSQCWINLSYLYRVSLRTLLMWKWMVTVDIGHLPLC